ncbi:MAG: hypothetical protein ACLSB7_11060 [Parabacteroides distasonis]
MPPLTVSRALSDDKISAKRRRGTYHGETTRYNTRSLTQYAYNTIGVITGNDHPFAPSYKRHSNLISGSLVIIAQRTRSVDRAGEPSPDGTFMGISYLHHENQTSYQRQGIPLVFFDRIGNLDVSSRVDDCRPSSWSA